MTPDTCPHCGAPHLSGNLYWKEWDCRTQADRLDLRGPWTYDQSPECARYVRVRVSQLKRMARCADKRMGELLDLDADDNGFSQGFYWRWFGRFTVFRDACLRKIDRLRGGA